MGRFTYNGAVKVEIEDRALAHIQVVIGNKLRRGEPFYFTWRDDASVGDGRTSVWLYPAVPLVFKYFGSRRPQLNGAWIDELAYVANTAHGLHVTPEPASDAVSHADAEFQMEEH